jgi:fatty-acyl-CoA synthase
VEGLMQDYPLTVPMIFRRAERLYGAKEIVTATTAGLERSTVAEWAARTRRLGGALDDLGLSDDARVGTFAWNNAHHLECYFAIPGTGRVLHTLNIRLFPEQVTYMVNHAEDEAIFVDRSLLGVLWPLVDTFKTVRHIVVMDDGTGEVPDDPRVLDYETLIAAAEPAEWRVTDENQAAAMCYTSGTTGNPKGVVYSHRSTVLHSMAALMADTIAVSESDVILPVVPMFHANAWGLAHAGVMAGSSFVFPGGDLSPASLIHLMETEHVTVAAGVPTIWIGVLAHLDGHDLSSLRRILCGGSAVPRALSESYREKVGVPITQAGGLTESHPVATVARVPARLAGESSDAAADIRASQGIAIPGIEVRIVEPGTGDELPWDGEARGEIQMAGAWVARQYYNDPRSKDAFTDDGWLRTGDVATISPDGYVRLVDRTKDLIKSGGEWISSVGLENELMAHPSVAEAAVVAVPHERWTERPLACVVVKTGAVVTREELLDWLAGRVAKWTIPDDVVFVEEIPRTSTGKFSKKDLRDRFADHRLPA